MIWATKGYDPKSSILIHRLDLGDISISDLHFPDFRGLSSQLAGISLAQFTHLPQFGRNNPSPAYICRTFWSSVPQACTQRIACCGSIPAQASDRCCIFSVIWTEWIPLRSGNLKTGWTAPSSVSAVVPLGASLWSTLLFWRSVYTASAGIDPGMDTVHTALGETKRYTGLSSGYSCSSSVPVLLGTASPLSRLHWT